MIGSIASDEGSPAAIWWEDDDLVWRPADLPALRSNTLLLDVVAGGPVLVAVGQDFVNADGPEPLVWVSVDGRSWAAVDTAGLGQGGMSHVAMGQAGLFAFGTGPSEEPHAWISPDGRHWTSSPSESTLTVASNPALVGAGPTLTAFVPPPPAANGERGAGPISVWRPSGSDSWNKVAELPASDGAYVDVAATGPLGWVALGQLEGHRLAWASVDGVTWQLAAAAPSRTVSTIFGDSTGFIGVGYYNTGTGCAISETDNVGQTWTSTDGNVWSLVDEFKSGEWIETLRRRNRTLIGIGLSYRDGDAVGTTWTARLPDTLTQPVPTPSPSPTPSPTSEGCGG